MNCISKNYVLKKAIKLIYITEKSEKLFSFYIIIIIIIVIMLWLLSSSSTLLSYINNLALLLTYYNSLLIVYCLLFSFFALFAVFPLGPSITDQKNPIRAITGAAAVREWRR